MLSYFQLSCYVMVTEFVLTYNNNILIDTVILLLLWVCIQFLADFYSFNLIGKYCLECFLISNIANTQPTYAVM